MTILLLYFDAILYDEIAPSYRVASRLHGRGQKRQQGSRFTGKILGYNTFGEYVKMALTKIYQSVLSPDCEVYAQPGRKSVYDFIITTNTWPSPSTPPKHIHWVEAMLKAHQQHQQVVQSTAIALVDAANRAYAVSQFPPIVPNYLTMIAKQLASQVNHSSSPSLYYGIPTDAFIVVVGMLFVQEKTNYPKGILHQLLSRMLKDYVFFPDSEEGNADLRTALLTIARWDPQAEALRLRTVWGRKYGLLP